MQTQFRWSRQEPTCFQACTKIENTFPNMIYEHHNAGMIGQCFSHIAKYADYWRRNVINAWWWLQGRERASAISFLLFIPGSLALSSPLSSPSWKTKWRPFRFAHNISGFRSDLIPCNQVYHMPVLLVDHQCIEVRISDWWRLTVFAHIFLFAICFLIEEYKIYVAINRSIEQINTCY